ncbi:MULTISPECIES: hypothetical protein [Leptolyngbya]|uniref:hypothetical protein n=1 Tax=Leptolyngbya TaxID=47251 RepID=UPI0016881107|nr:hypothetical protein [Leptolyngbya sp. FACHB-1624]MBD1860018.1 hypothetical protein [Leptolyngbya sp. FACHB-1624]
MTHELHTSQIKHFIDANFRATLASWGLLAGSLILLACGSNAQTPQGKLGFFGGAVAIAMIAQPIRKIAIDTERGQNDQADLSTTANQNWFYGQMKPDAPIVALAPSEPEPVELLSLFEWSELSDADEHPILGIVSPMGGGKSRLARYLARYILFPGQNPQISVFDVYARSNDWEGCSIVTEHDGMIEAMEADLDVIAGRLQEYRAGKDEFVGMFRVLEEGADTFKTLQAMGKDSQKIVDSWVSKFTTVTRKVKARMCIVSVKMSGADFGTGAESRNDATIIFPGAKGIAKAMTDDRIFKLGAKQNKELRGQLQASLAGIKRPALVYSQGNWYPASVPDLDANGNPTGITAVNFSFPVEHLNRLYEMSIEDEETIEDSHRLTDTQEAILELSERQGWIRAKDCSISGWSQFNGKSADDIREDFQTLIDLGLGVGRFDGNRLQFCSDEWNSDDSE